MVIIALSVLAPARADTFSADSTAGNESDANSTDTPSMAKGLLISPELSTKLPDLDTPLDNNLWARIKSGYAMPELDSPFTATQESWYAARPDYVKRMMARSQKYLFHVVEEVQKRGMPTEIALLPMVESAFNPQAYSTGHASGIWQFVPATGKNFGLKQTWWVDNRRDVTAATDAALTYLQKLHVMFGSWDLALAAYNAGEGTVMRAIQNNRKKGLPTDYQSLSLPPETRAYVPKLQAVKNIVNNPEQYGLDIQPIANTPYFTQVSAPKQIDTKLAARLAGVSLEEFISLNPEYNRPVMTSSAGKNEILLPIGREDEFAANLANYNKPLVNWQTYNARRGERLDSVARKFGVTVAQLRDVNDLGAKPKLNASRPLLVPTQGQPPATADLSAESMAATPHADEKTSKAALPPNRQYTVTHGDTVKSIAKHYGLTPRQLMTLNHLKTLKLKNGQTLLVQVQPTASPKGSQSAKTVASTRHSSKLAKTNSASRQDATKGKGHSQVKNTKTKPGIRLYLVKHGDSIDGIAHKFDVDVTELRRWNKLSGNHLTPGHKLVISRPNAA